MSAVNVLSRISKKQPEISADDIAAVMKSMVRFRQRETGEWVAVGFDGNNRFVEIVYLYNEDLDEFLVYHGMTPPSSKTLRELGLI